MAITSDPVICLQYLIARSATFRTWCGITGTEAAMQTAALARTHPYMIDLDAIADAAYPAILVVPARSSYSRQSAGGAGLRATDAGATLTVYATFSNRDDTIAVQRAALETFVVNVRALALDLRNASGSAASPYAFTRLEEVNDYTIVGSIDSSDTPRELLAVDIGIAGPPYGSLTI